MCSSTNARMRRVILAGLYVGTATLVSATAQAQSVNYSELQELFDEPVTTSVTGKPQRVSEAPASLIIVTRDDIRRSPAKDIPGLIQAYAGIDVVHWTAGQSDISVRGGVQALDPRLLVLVNGRQVYLDHYGMTNWAGIGVQLSEIQQIEIVRGPNSALFGFNAVSGVVNIITLNPLHVQQRVTTLEAGDSGYLHVSQSVAIKLASRLGLRLSGGYEKSQELAGLNTSPLAPADSLSPITPYNIEGAGELYGKIDDRTEGSLSASYTKNRQFEVPAPLAIFSTRYRFGSVGASISHDTGWGMLSAHALHNWSVIDASAIDFRNQVFLLSGDALVRAGKSDTVRVGLEYRQNQLTTSPGYSGAVRYRVYAGSAMWEHRLNEAVIVTIAGRLDHLRLGLDGDPNQPTIFTKEDFDRSITALSFNSALSLKLNGKSSLRLAAARGIQAPSLFSLGARLDLPMPGSPFPLVISGNPAINPPRISSAELGFIRTFDEVAGRLELTAFYNRTSDVISASGTVPRAAPPAFPFLQFTSDNVGSFTAYGLEASLSGQVGTSWVWALNYTWTKAHQEITGNGGGSFERPLALDSATPAHKIKAQLSYEHGPWLATVAGRFTTDIKQLISVGLGAGLELVDIKDNLALDAKLAFKVSDAATITIAGQNLTDNGDVGLSPVPAERRLRAGLQVSF